jgi:hypothetical protein
MVGQALWSRAPSASGWINKPEAYYLFRTNNFPIDRGELFTINGELLNHKRIEQPKLFHFLDTAFDGEQNYTIEAIKDYFRSERRSYYIPAGAGGPIAFYLSGMLFSAFHILAWNWDFPSRKVRIAWRVFGVVATSANPLMALTLTIPEFAGIEIIFLILVIIYPVSRVGLIVIIFYCFSSMPVEIYQTVEWTKIFPHFG